MTTFPYEDQTSEGNSATYHTGKACVEKGCEEPAGTWWSPLWCFKHNVERMKRIDASLNDMVRIAEHRAAVDKETETLRKWAYKMSNTIKAIVLAGGGQVTIKNSDLERKCTYEGATYGKDTTTFRYR